MAKAPRGSVPSSVPLALLAPSEPSAAGVDTAKGSNSISPMPASLRGGGTTAVGVEGSSRVGFRELNFRRRHFRGGELDGAALRMPVPRACTLNAIRTERQILNE